MAKKTGGRKPAKTVSVSVSAQVRDELKQFVRRVAFEERRDVDDKEVVDEALLAYMAQKDKSSKSTRG